MNLPGVSIVICTHNGKKNLGPTLEHIAAQKEISDIKVELLLVDNASTDGTVEFVTNKWPTLQTSIALRIINEPKLGKANASVTGFNACSYEIIIVCDDDNWLCGDYIKKAYLSLSSNEKIGALGGKSEAVFEGFKPTWFEFQKHIYAVGEQFNSNGKQIGTLWGAGMVFRKTAWDRLMQLNYSFFLNEQRSGNSNWGGDDIELCEVIALLGYEIWYDNSLSIKHYLPLGRMQINYLHSRYYGLGRSRLYLHAYLHFRTNNEMPMSHLKYPLWLDRYFHKTKELLKAIPVAVKKTDESTRQDVLNYIALKGELMELWRIKDFYTQIFKRILDLKKQIQNNNAHISQ